MNKEWREKNVNSSQSTVCMWYTCDGLSPLGLDLSTGSCRVDHRLAETRQRHHALHMRHAALLREKTGSGNEWITMLNCTTPKQMTHPCVNVGKNGCMYLRWSLQRRQAPHISKQLNWITLRGLTESYCRFNSIRYWFDSALIWSALYRISSNSFRYHERLYGCFGYLK